MATITKGKTFISGETVEPGDLHQLVDSATVTNIVNADISASAAIAASKLASTLDLSTKTVTLPDSNIGTTKIADSAVTTDKINNAAVTAAKLDGAQTGSAPIYGCRAWVNFDGTKDSTGASSTGNTNRLIRASGNVSSVLRNSTGTYTITMTQAMPDENYAILGMAQNSSGLTVQVDGGNTAASTQRTSSAVRVNVAQGSSGTFDSSVVSVAIFR